MNAIVSKIDNLLLMLSKTYRFLLINLILESMKHRVDGVENKLDQITETLEALNENKKSIQLKLENLNKEVDAIVNS
ncbi:MAG: hypothetical protein KKC53_05855 [Actinobacteria bacterium]|nr:hypothetical protein [Actinomycetota bacterium]